MNDNESAEPVIESAPEATPQQYNEAPQQEKMVPQSEVNKLIGSVKQKAYDKAKGEFHVEQSPQQYQQPMQQQPAQQPQQQAYDQTQDVREIAKQAAVEAQKEYQTQQQSLWEQQQAQQARDKVLESLAAKANEAKTRYSDYDEVLTSAGHLDAIPGMHEALSGFDNAGDMLYDLSKNPGKIGNILALAQHDQKLAYVQLQNLSNSIKQNQTAKNGSRAPQPLQSITHSNVGMDNGNLTVSDLRKKYR